MKLERMTGVTILGLSRKKYLIQLLGRMCYDYQTEYQCKIDGRVKRYNNSSGSCQIIIQSLVLQ